ncbi:MAG: DUF4160 domain-containing protein [Clostridia bacterium]|nr:DUF4160 domain-containing protein [Clostridia bacterium]
MKCIEHNFSDLIRDFGSFNFFYPIFNLCEQRARVSQYKQIIFEIRPKEQGHNEPHVHACYENENISISLITFKVIAGNIPPKQQKLAIEWTKNHIDILKNKWLEYHKYLIPVLGGKKPW